MARFFPPRKKVIGRTAYGNRVWSPHLMSFTERNILFKKKSRGLFGIPPLFFFSFFPVEKYRMQPRKKTHLNGNNRQQKHREGAAGALVGHFTARGIYGNRAEAYQRQGRWAFVAMGNRILIVNEKKKKTEYTDTITEKEAHRKQQTRTRVKKKKKLPLFTCDSHWSRAIYSGVQTIIFSIWERERRLFRAPTEVMMIGI